jgi:hypothetical protein
MRQIEIVDSRHDLSAFFKPRSEFFIFDGRACSSISLYKIHNSKPDPNFYQFLVPEPDTVLALEKKFQ